MNEADIEAELARRNKAHIDRITAATAEMTAAADRINELAAVETDALVVSTLKAAAARLHSDARTNEKWLVDLRRIRDRRASQT